MVQAPSDIVTAEIQAQFESPEEVVMYSERTQKLRLMGGGTSSAASGNEEDRIYIQTTDNIYTFRLTRQGTYKCTRFYSIKNVGAIILSEENEHDFMLFFFMSEDLHLRSNNREELLSLLRLRFYSFNRNYTLRIYSVPSSSLANYHLNNTTQNKINGVYDLPPDNTRLLDIELKGEDEFNEELKMQRPDAPNNIEEGEQQNVFNAQGPLSELQSRRL